MDFYSLDCINCIDFHVFIPTIGGLGQLGTGLAKLLRKQYGTENIILSDIIRPKKDILENGKLKFGPNHYSLSYKGQ